MVLKLLLYYRYITIIVVVVVVLVKTRIAFRVSARRYRSTTCDAVVGVRTIVDNILNEYVLLPYRNPVYALVFPSSVNSEIHERTSRSV